MHVQKVVGLASAPGKAREQLEQDIPPSFEAK